MKPAVYSLITMQPNMERLDVLCIGAAILAEGEWTICTLPDATKLQAVDGGFRLATLVAVSNSLQEMFAGCTTLAQARQALAGNRSSVVLHEFEGTFGYQTEADFKEQIKAIMAESVLPVAGPRSRVMVVRRAQSRIRTRLRRQFHSMGILGATPDDINDHKVVANYPVSAKYGLVAEFALKNGGMNFTETLDFKISDEGRKNKTYEAQAKCLVLRAASDNFGKKTKGHIIVAGADARSDATIDLLSTVGHIYALESAEDMAAYFEAIESAAQVGGTLR